MKNHFLRVPAACALLLLVSSCSMLKDHLARRGYVSQMLCDYTYDAPPDEVWAEAMLTLGLPENAGTARDGRRVYLAAPHPPSQDGKQYPGLKVVVEARGDRTWLGIFRQPWGAPEPDERDLHARDVDAELAVLRTLNPDDARRFERGAYAAGKGAR